MKQFRTYLRVLALTTTVGSGTLIAFNALVDPYGITDFALFDRKPYASTRVKMFKAYAVTRVAANGVTLGNSRVEVGLDPKSSQWPPDTTPVYNLGIPGAGVYATSRFLQHAIAHRKPRLVVMGLDFMDFRVEPGESEHRSNEFEDRLLVRKDGITNGNRFSARLRDWVSSTASLDALIDSIATVAQNGRSGTANITRNGFNPLHEYHDYVREAGHFNLFKQRNVENMRAYGRRPWRIRKQNGEPSEAFSHLDAIVALCRTHHIEMHLYIHPVHAHLNETIRLAGLWPIFEEWKREVVRVVEANNLAHGGQPRISLWDFSGYNPITVESVPHNGDHRPMRWYWEAGHYKSSVGELVLRTLFHQEFRPLYPNTSFGVRLDSDKLEAHLRKIRAEGQAYRKTHEPDIERLARLAATVLTNQRDPITNTLGSE